MADELEVEEVVETTLMRTQVTADHQTNREEKQWEAIRDECESGGEMNDKCNIVAASLGQGKLDVVAKRLSCGCILMAVDSDGEPL